jgi:hypothetical protein
MHIDWYRVVFPLCGINCKNQAIKQHIIFHFKLKYVTYTLKVIYYLFYKNGIKYIVNSDVFMCLYVYKYICAHFEHMYKVN